MMDTDAIYSAVLDYGAAKRARFSSDEELDHRDRVKRLLNEADAERQELLATNEKLVDEVNELKAKLTEKASLLRGCYARINTLERTLTHIHGVALAEGHRDLPGIAKDTKEALEKKHESDH